MTKLFILFFALFISMCSYCQETNDDSIHLAQHLEPFRKHLDSVTKDVNAKKLLSLYKNNFPLNATGKVEANTSSTSIDHFPITQGIRPIKLLSPIKYSYAEIIPNDTNNLLFVETEYQLQNRYALEFYKIKFRESKTLKDQIYSCISYISELSRFYPTNEHWKFSKSQTLHKYIYYTTYLIDKLPRDTTKAYLLGDFAYALKNIDKIELQSRILEFYLNAERLLLTPYNNYLKEKKLVEDSAYFRKYVKQGSIGNALININYHISDLLKPSEGIGLMMELYPFLKKRLFYLERALKVFEIQKGTKDLPNNYTRVENEYLSALTYFHLPTESKYYSDIIKDRIYLLENYLSKLISPGRDVLTERRQYNLYYAVGCIFFGQKEYGYALKAFYKAGEIRLNYIDVPIAIDDISFLIDIFETILKQKESGKYFERQHEINDLAKMYQDIINRELPLDKYDSTFFEVFKLLGESSVMVYIGQSHEAENLLVSKKKELFQDTTLAVNHPALFGMLYKGLLHTNWVPDNNAVSEDEREADSLFFLFKKKGTLDVEASYNGDEYVAEKLTSLGAIENNTYWNAKTEELSEEINGKAREIASLNETRNILYERIYNLNVKVNDLTALSKSLKNETSVLKRNNSSYSDSLSAKQKVITQLNFLSRFYDSLAKLNKKSADSYKTTNNTLQIEAKRLESDNYISKRARNMAWGLFGLALALLIPVIIQRSKLKKKNRVLAMENTENNYKHKLEIEKGRTELSQLNNLAKNKIHNFQNDFHTLPNMLQAGQIEKAIKYTNEYGSYQTVFFENWKKEVISLDDEISLLKQYVEVKNASGKPVSLQFEIPRNEINVSKTRFIQSVFDTLLDNSIRRGFKDKEGVCLFNVSIYRKAELLLCEVSDNGIPPSDSTSYFRREGSGLNILKSRIKAMFDLSDKKTPRDFFTAAKLPGDLGTIIKIKMPYEQIF